MVEATDGTLESRNGCVAAAEDRRAPPVVLVYSNPGHPGLGRCRGPVTRGITVADAVSCSILVAIDKS